MNRTYRMYGLVPYNLSPIQQGIQYGHAVQEYNNFMSVIGNTDETKADKEAFDKWRNEDKTFIILNGGTTNSNPERFGTLNIALMEAIDHGLKVASFREPDLGDQLTAFVFLVDDRVFDRVTWPDYRMPDFEKEMLDDMLANGGDLDSALESFESYRIWFNNFSDNYFEAERIVWMRSWLKKFKLA